MRPIRLGGRRVAVGLILTGGFLAAGALPASAQTGEVVIYSARHSG